MCWWFSLINSEEQSYPPPVPILGNFVISKRAQYYTGNICSRYQPALNIAMYIVYTVSVYYYCIMYSTTLCQSVDCLWLKAGYVLLISNNVVAYEDAH